MSLFQQTPVPCPVPHWVGDNHGSVGRPRAPGLCRVLGQFPSGVSIQERSGESPSGLRRLLTPPFLLLSESFLASFCDQPVLQRLWQMANYHNAQSFWGSWVQTQVWPSQEQLHLLRHVEPTLSFTHTPILTFPMGSWWLSLEQMAKRNTREKPSQPAVVSLFQFPILTDLSWHEAHYPHCIFLSWYLFSGQAQTLMVPCLAVLIIGRCGFWTKLCVWQLRSVSPCLVSTLGKHPSPQVRCRTPHQLN